MEPVAGSDAEGSQGEDLTPDRADLQGHADGGGSGEEASVDRPDQGNVVGLPESGAVERSSDARGDAEIDELVIEVPDDLPDEVTQVVPVIVAQVYAQIQNHL